MPTSQKPKVKKYGKSSSIQMEMLKELRRLNENIDEFHEYMEHVVRKQKKTKIFDGFVAGIGRFFGTLIAAALLALFIYIGGRYLIESQAFQEWLGNLIAESLKSTTESLLPFKF